MSRGLKFSLTFKNEKIDIDGQEYVLRELNGQERGQYLDSVGNRIIVGKDGQPSGMKSFDGLEASLLKLCLEGPDGKLVPADTLAKWPSTVLQDLFENATRLSGLDKFSKKEKEAEAKNG